MSLTNTKYHKKTVLQVLPALVSGGVERGTIEIAQQLQELGFNSIVISAGGPLVEKLISVGGTHIKLNVATKNPFMIWRNARLIAQIIKKYNVDLIHARSRAPAWSCYIAAKKTGIIFITTFHGIYNISSFIKKYYNKIMTEGRKVIAVSDFVKSHIIKYYNTPEDKIVVIHRGVDHRYFNPSNLSNELLGKFRDKYDVPAKVPVILLPSRMTSWKGHAVLIEALNRIKDLEYYCLIVGDLSKHPNFAKQIQSQISELKLKSKVQIFGNEPDMLGLYGISDIVLSTSIEPEAFGRTVIEGQAMERIVIATNIGGAAETIVDGQNGYHVVPDDPISLSEKIRHCLSSLQTKEHEILVKNARSSVIENFSLDLMLSKTMSLYEEVLKNNNAKS